MQKSILKQNIIFLHCFLFNFLFSGIAFAKGETRFFDFNFNQGKSHSFESVFRDLPVEIYREYERRKTTGLPLGPRAPLEKPPAQYPEETSHWLLNTGFFPLPDGLRGIGFLLQGNNHSDDLDMFLVRKFGKAEGLQANALYRLRVTVDLAGDAPAGAVGVGGAPDLTVLAAVVSDFNPTQYRVDQGIVRHPHEDWREIPSAHAIVGTNAVCRLEDSPSIGNLEQCPRQTRIPFQINQGLPSSILTIETNSNGEFWLMVGTHSGFESFSAIYYTRIQVEILP